MKLISIRNGKIKIRKILIGNIRNKVKHRKREMILMSEWRKNWSESLEKNKNLKISSMIFLILKNTKNPKENVNKKSSIN